jgi:hypothetical protein
MRILPHLLCAAALTACSTVTEIPGPTADLSAHEVEGLTVGLEVEPAVVGPHEDFTVTFTVANTTGDTIRLGTPHSCLALPSVVRDGHRVPFAGSSWGCLTVIRTHTFAPGDERTMTYQMRSELYSEHPGDGLQGVAAPKGHYRVQMVFESAGNPVVERTLVVR